LTLFFSVIGWRFIGDLDGAADPKDLEVKKRNASFALFLQYFLIKITVIFVYFLICNNFFLFSQKRAISVELSALQTSYTL